MTKQLSCYGNTTATSTHLFIAKKNAQGYYVLFPKGERTTDKQILVTDLDVALHLLQNNYVIRVTSTITNLTANRILASLTIEYKE